MAQGAQGLRHVGHRDGRVPLVLAALLLVVLDGDDLRRDSLSVSRRRRLNPLLDRLLQLHAQSGHLRHDQQVRIRMHV